MPAESIGYWTHRFVDKGIPHEAPTRRFGQPVLAFTDPDGLSLALVGVPGAEAEPAWSGSEVPADHAIRGLAGVTLLLETAAPTAAVLTDVLGFAEVGREDTHIRYRAYDGPGGVLFEIATDAPGFTVDEPLTELGGSLRLPAFLEPRRKQLEMVLPSLETAA